MRTYIFHIATGILLLSLGYTPGVEAQVPQKSDHQYKVVINHEEQYSIWRAGEKAPSGWKDTRFAGTLDQCHDYIEEVWTDMRPLSIRKMNLPKDTQYRVVINHEEQYSIWPMKKPVPRSWKALKTQGTLTECMDYIEEVWTDMRPLSLRKRPGRTK